MLVPERGEPTMNTGEAGDPGSVTQPASALALVEACAGLPAGTATAGAAAAFLRAKIRAAAR